MSPNPTVISQSQEGEEDRSFWKAIVLAVFGAGFSFLAVYLFDEFFRTASYGRAVLGILSLLGFFVFFILQVFFVKSRVKIGFLILLQVIAPLLLYLPAVYPRPSEALLGGALVFFLFLVTGAARGQGVLKNSLEIKFFTAAKAALPKAVTGFIVLLTVIFYLNYFVWGNFTDELGRVFVNETLSSARPIVGIVLSGVSFEGTVGDFLDVVAENQLRKIKAGTLGTGSADKAIDFQQLPPPEKERIIREVSFAMERELEKFVGLLERNDSLQDTVYRIIKDYFANLSAPAKSIFAAAAVLFFFLTVKGIAVLFYWLPEFLAYLVYKFFLIIGFAYVSLESRSREFIMLS